MDLKKAIAQAAKQIKTTEEIQALLKEILHHLNEIFLVTLRRQFVVLILPIICFYFLVDRLLSH
jgi:DNA-binding phage protein